MFGLKAVGCWDKLFVYFSILWRTRSTRLNASIMGSSDLPTTMHTHVLFECFLPLGPLGHVVVEHSCGTKISMRLLGSLKSFGLLKAAFKKRGP